MKTESNRLDGLFVPSAYAVKAIKATRVVLDGVQALFAGVSDTALLRSDLRQFFRWLDDNTPTTIVTGEAGIDTTPSPVSFFMNRFLSLGPISSNGRFQVHKTLLIHAARSVSD